MPCRASLAALLRPYKVGAPADKAWGRRPLTRQLQEIEARCREVPWSSVPFPPCAAPSKRLRARKATVALVPTMGALHDGHVSLVRLARRRAQKVVVSIFVNPTQFAPTEDFGSYPRTWKADVAKLAAEKVDLIWNPDVKAMYPEGFATRIVPEGPATAGLEDRFRPHFFGGVATVVGKLFTQVPAGCRDLRREGFSAIAGGDADGRRSRPRRQGDRLAHRAGTRRAGDVLAQRLPLGGGTADGADALPRHEGKRQAAEGRRGYRGRDGRRPRN